MRAIRSLAVLSTVLVLACADLPSSPPGPSETPAFVVGGARVGDAAFAEDWPFAAAIFATSASSFQFFCTGSVIGARWVVTAGHCTRDAQLYVASGFTIRVGVGNPDWFEMTFIPADESITAPGFGTTSGGPVNDIGLIRLATDAAVTPARLPAAGITGLESVRVAGWGETGSGPAQQLQTLALPVTGQDDGILYTSSSVGSLCSGDSGGPAIDGVGTLVGVASFVFPACGPRGISGHTVVADHVPWIMEVTGIAPAAADGAGPVVTVFAGDPVAVSAAVTVAALIDDTSTGDSPIASAELRLDGGEPIAMSASDGAFDQPVEAVSAAFVAPAEPGLYEVCAGGTDSAGNAASPACTVLVVYDPSAGFATGAGRIAAGDGEAHFAFVSRYRKGASLPDGNTKFTFRAASLDFRNTAYDWLVVKGNGEAQFLGSGVIAGQPGEFRFMLWAADRDAGDTFRIRIWRAGDEEAVVFDNGVMQPLLGGNIVVHRK